MDPITDIGIIGTISAMLIPSVPAFIDDVATFFGEDAVFAGIQGLGALAKVDASQILNVAVFADGGIIHSIVLPEIINEADKQVIINSANTIGRALWDKGITVSSEVGKELFIGAWEKIKELGPTFSASAIGGYIGQKLAEKGIEVKNEVVDKIVGPDISGKLV